MAGNAKESRILEYKDIISQLNTTIAAQAELIRSLKQDLESDRAEKKILLEKIDYLTQKLFGTSSEKTKDIKGQINLFDEAEQEADTDPEIPVITVPEHTRKKKSTHEELFKGVPSRDEVIPLPEEQRKCTECGAALEPIGKEFVRHEFRFTPAKGVFLLGTREDISLKLCQRAGSMTIAIRLFRASSSVLNFSSMNGSLKAKNILTNSGKHIVWKKKNQYSMHSGHDWNSKSQPKEPASRRR